jgi:hypothetical protein
MFSDGMFHPTSLATLGLVIQLNHRQGDCPAPVPPFRDFTVYDVNGVHQVKVVYCGCHLTDPDHVLVHQIFRQRWLPATWKQPRTAFTYSLLKMFHIVNLQSKCNMYDWYNAMLWFNNNAGLVHQPVSDSQYLLLVSGTNFCRIIITNSHLLFESGVT